jgi:hypothetical protein
MFRWNKFHYLINNRRKEMSENKIITKDSSNEDRIAYLGELDLYIPHTWVKKLYDALDYRMNLSRVCGIMGLLVTGHPGSGKTTACKKYAQGFLPKSTNSVELFPVLYIDCPYKITPKSLVEECLKAYNDPDYNKGNASELEMRLVYYINECKTRLIFIDEIHNILPKHAKNGLSSAAKESMNFIKNLTNKTNANIVLMGGEDSKMLFDDPHIRRRFSMIYRMPLLRKDQVLQGVLKSMESKLPLRKPSNLAEASITDLIFEITKGQMMGIQILVREAAKLAVQTGTECVTKELISFCAEKAQEMSKYSSQELEQMNAYEHMEKFETKNDIKGQEGLRTFALPQPIHSRANLLVS